MHLAHDGGQGRGRNGRRGTKCPAVRRGILGHLGQPQREAQVEMGEGVARLGASVVPVGLASAAPAAESSDQSEPGQPSIPPSSPLSGRVSSSQAPSARRAR